MAKESILLVKLPYKDSYYSFYVDFPAGLGILSEALSFNGIEHDVYDMQANNSFDDFCAEVDRLKPSYIGFSMMTFKYLHNYEFIGSVKEKFPDIRIVVGGPHASTFKEKILEECAAVDIVVNLEGEDVLVELCNGAPLNEIRGIIYRENNNIVQTERREYIKELDKFPFPKLNKFNMENYREIPVITSRGCPYGCIYCPISVTIGKQWRYRHPEKIVDELEHWVNQGWHKLQIVDDNFTFNRERVVKICEGIKERGIGDKLQITLTNGIRADKVDYELLKLMRECGFFKVAFGVESGSERILKVLNKGEDLATIEKAIKLACDLDFEVELFFVLGAPTETEKDVRMSIELAVKYSVIDAPFYHLIPFPGTELSKWVTENNKFRFKSPEFLNDASHWVNEPLFTTDELDLAARKRLYHLANKKSREHTQKVLNRRMARELSKKFNVPSSLLYLVIAFLKNDAVKEFLNKTHIWDLLKKVKNRGS